MSKDKCNRCFVISVIGAEGSPERKDADTLLQYIITPAAKQAGYDVVERADQDGRPGMIPHQIIEKILTYELVIADLTYPNPNVYYEMAIRHCTGKRYVQLRKHGSELPFDVEQVRTASFGLQVDEADRAQADLLKQIRAVDECKEPILNPVSQTRWIMGADAGGDQTEKMLAAVLDHCERIQMQLTALRAPITSPYTPYNALAGMPTSMPPVAPFNAITRAFADPGAPTSLADIPALARQTPDVTKKSA